MKEFRVRFTSAPCGITASLPQMPHRLCLPCVKGRIALRYQCATVITFRPTAETDALGPLLTIFFFFSFQLSAAFILKVRQCFMLLFSVLRPSEDTTPLYGIGDVVRAAAPPWPHQSPGSCRRASIPLSAGPVDLATVRARRPEVGADALNINMECPSQRGCRESAAT